MSRAKRFIQETAWYGIFSNSKVFLRLFTSVVLVRLLSPEDFGLVSMAGVFVAFAVVLVDGGMSTAFVQRAEVTEQHTSALFIHTVGLGLVLSGSLILGRSWVAAFYAEPLLEPLIIGLALTLLFASVEITPTSLLRRQVKFKRIGMIGLVRFVVSFAVTAAFALADYRAMSIILGQIAGDVYAIVATSRSANWRPSLHADWVSYQEILAIGGWLFIVRILSFFSRETDTILVGQQFGAGVLGVYNRAYMVMMLPVSKIQAIISQTALPTLKDFQDDNERLYVAIEKMIVAELLLLVPVVLILWAERWMLIRFIYGTAWLDAARYLTILLPVSLLDLSKNHLLLALVVKGRTRENLGFSLVAMSIGIGSIAYGASTGDIMYMIAAFSGARAALHLPTMYVGMRCMEQPLMRNVYAQAAPLWDYSPLFVLVAAREAGREWWGIQEPNVALSAAFVPLFAAVSVACLFRIAKLERYQPIFAAVPLLQRVLQYLRPSKADETDGQPSEQS